MRLPASLCRVIHLTLPSGERIPSLVYRATGLPVRLAIRWIARDRRRVARPSTMDAELYTIGLLYDWAWTWGRLDLDDYLTSGNVLSPEHLQALIVSLEQSSPRRVDPIIVSGEVFDRRLSTVSAFLTWALYPENRGGTTVLSRDQLAVEHAQITRILDFARINVITSKRREPFTAEQITTIRKVLGGKREQGGDWHFPNTCFSPATRLRNWLMIEMAVELGFRRSELLKLHDEGLPKGNSTTVLLKHRRDDPNDPRVIEPSTKTTERGLPVPDHIRNLLRAYVTTRPPLGRRGHRSAYLFTTGRGEPLSIAGAASIMSVLGEATGITPMSWHRFRHTWAETWAEQHLEHPLADEVLMTLGGWRTIESARHYTQHARRRIASALGLKRVDRLFGEENGDE